MDYQNVGSLVAEAARRNGDKVALIVDHENGRYTFNQLNKRVNQVANALVQNGVKAGDHVGVMLNNGAIFAFTWLALARLGCVMVPAK